MVCQAASNQEWERNHTRRKRRNNGRHFLAPFALLVVTLLPAVNGREQNVVDRELQPLEMPMSELELSGLPATPEYGA
jgi:hypothetical protein